MDALNGEPIAIRHPVFVAEHYWSRQWHRIDPNRTSPMTACVFNAVPLTERTPLAQVPASDRCTTCWPATKETP